MNQGANWKKIFRVCGLVALIMMFSTVGYVTVVGASVDDDQPEKFKDVKSAVESMYLLKQEYYKPISMASMIMNYIKTGTINGMLEILGDSDPYTGYMDKDSFTELKESNEGIFGGVGVVIGNRNGKVTVINPVDGTPAMKAGIQSGDKIVSVDGVSTENAYVDYVSSLLKGEPGTTVLVGIDRYGEKFEVELVREIINDQAARYYMFDEDLGIGYIELKTFSKKAGPDIQAALDDLTAQGMKALVLDLRFNGGGLVDQAIEVASKFIPSGPVVHVKPRNGNVTTFNTVSERVIDIPMVVLVNQYTASASEILSGALQDTGVATIVGMPTFGKGLVQTLFTLSDGSGLAVTSQIYLTAGGREITHENPITPDVEVEIEDISEEEYQARIQKAQEDEANGVRLTAEEMSKIDITLDTQMRTAVELLTEQLSQSDEELKTAA